jgi:hypothetical protein
MESNAACCSLHADFLVIKTSSMLWDMTPCSVVKVKTHFSEEHIAYIFKTEEKAMQESSMKQASSKKTCSSETSVDFQLTTRHYTPEGRTL